MSDRKRTWGWMLLLAAGLSLLWAVPAWAQGAAGGEGTSNISFFRKFFLIEEQVQGRNEISWFGTLLVWSCFVFSTGVLALIINNLLQSRLSAFVPSDLEAEIDRLVSERNFREAIDRVSNEPSPFGQVMRVALNEAPRGYGAMEAAVDETADTIGNRKIRNLIWLEVAGAAGPMIGLFGTVFGMITAFNRLVGAGGAPKPAELAGGIATALVCTFWGLIVGIPGVIAASLFRVRLEGLTAETALRAKQILGAFKPGAAKKAPAAATPAAKPAATPA